MKKVCSDSPEEGCNLLPDANLVLQNVEEEDEVVLHLATRRRAAARFYARWP
jgi:hypothetical protein